MASSYSEAMDRAAADARALVRYLDGLGENPHATPAAMDHAAGMADMIERTVYQAIREAYPGRAAKAPADQALEGIDAFRAAARGNDVDLMRAAAHEVLDHLARAQELSAPPAGDER